MRSVRALNIAVPEDLFKRWLGWFAPDPQPFLADAELAALKRERTGGLPLDAELRDTYGLYELPGAVRLVWFSEAQFMALPKPGRSALVQAQRTFHRELVPSVRSWRFLIGQTIRQQADGHRFVWWRSLLDGCARRILRDYIEEGRRPSRHDEVPAQVWDSATQILPGARRLAGTFAGGSGPNCFGTVMAAAGVNGADTVWMQRGPFERWLSEMTRPGGDDAHAGTVLVWRSPDGLVQHAAVTIGEGWVLHKPSQGWMSPNKILTSHEAKLSARSFGRRLSRHRLRA